MSTNKPAGGARRIRLGIVGAGLIWEKSHRHKLSELDHLFEVVAFAAESERTRARLGSEYPELKVLAVYQDVLRLDEVDAVVVLTPLHLNAAVTIAALGAGKHVLVEKPMATCLDDVRTIIDLEKRARRKVLVLEQFRYDETLGILEDILGEGRIGDIVSYEMVDHGRIDRGEYNAGGYGNTSWRINPEFPLGTLFDRGIHAITRLTRLFGRPESVYSVGTKLREEFGDYDHVLLALAHPEGIHGTFSFAGYLDDSSNYFYIRGTKGTIRVGRTRLEVSGEHAGDVDLPRADAALCMWQRCAQWFADSNIPVYGATESLDDIATLVAADESIREGRKVSLR